mmetsp:Transcript_19317/g.63117  ORF Transcript_19317/g.63117 Transcript_19317/m.63117 type:complete len:379 (+) Transcript_19317:1624-2760(+)
MKARVHASTSDRVQQNLARVRGMKSREGSFDKGHSQELSPRNASPEELKERKAREARANAKNELHKEMFEVADELGGMYSQLRDPQGDVRFEAKDLIFGQPAQAARGVAHYLCVSDTEYRDAMNLGLQAVREEVARNGTKVDKECLTYVLDMEAGSSDKAFQGGLKRDCDKDGSVLPSRLTAEGRGMRLSDFVAHKDADEAGLSEAHVAALRFYTTAAFATINNGLRDQARYRAGRPHPLPVTVAFIKEALGLLRVVAANQSKANMPVTLYRGMKSMKVQDNFLQQGRGGTELAPMSTTRSLKVAMQYSASEDSLLLRIDTRNFMVRGPEISFLSAFPEEEEYLFPPLTYLEPTPGGVQTLRVDDATFTVIDVQAQPS